MVKVTLLNNNQHEANEIHITRESFGSIVEWLCEGARSTRINSADGFAEIKHEVRNTQGAWVTRTVTVEAL